MRSWLDQDGLSLAAYKMATVLIRKRKIMEKIKVIVGDCIIEFKMVIRSYNWWQFQFRRLC